MRDVFEFMLQMLIIGGSSIVLLYLLAMLDDETPTDKSKNREGNSIWK